MSVRNGDILPSAMLPKTQKPPEKRTLLLVGRDAWQKDEALNLLLLGKLAGSQLNVVWEDPAAEVIHILRKVERKIAWLPVVLRRWNLRLVQVAYGLRHPSYFFYLYDRKNPSIALRCENLRKIIRAFGPDRELVILSRSSGGRVASLIADEFNVRQLVCLAYPFKHPAAQDEPERYRHLARLKTPMLIVQGARDAYGGREAQDRYVFSERIELMFVDTDHDFDIDDQTANAIVERIARAAGLVSEKAPRK